MENKNCSHSGRKFSGSISHHYRGNYYISTVGKQRDLELTIIIRRVDSNGTHTYTCISHPFNIVLKRSPKSFFSRLWTCRNKLERKIYKCENRTHYSTCLVTHAAYFKWATEDLCKKIPGEAPGGWGHHPHTPLPTYGTQSIKIALTSTILLLLSNKY